MDSIVTPGSCFFSFVNMWCLNTYRNRAALLLRSPMVLQLAMRSPLLSNMLCPNPHGLTKLVHAVLSLCTSRSIDSNGRPPYRNCKEPKRSLHSLGRVAIVYSFSFVPPSCRVIDTEARLWHGGHLWSEKQTLLLN